MKRLLGRNDVVCEIEIKRIILVITEGRKALLDRIACYL